MWVECKCLHLHRNLTGSSFVVIIAQVMKHQVIEWLLDWLWSIRWMSSIGIHFLNLLKSLSRSIEVVSICRMIFVRSNNISDIFLESSVGFNNMTMHVDRADRRFTPKASFPCFNSCQMFTIVLGISYLLFFGFCKFVSGYACFSTMAVDIAFSLHFNLAPMILKDCCGSKSKNYCAACYNTTIQISSLQSLPTTT